MSITQDLKWNEHVNKITKKAAKRLYLLKQLKRFGLDSKDLKCFFIASIRTILEYACQVFHYGLPKYLSDVIEGIRRYCFTESNAGIFVSIACTAWSEGIYDLEMAVSKE